jgi:metallophosphoesterase superfamily enzyme
MRLGDEWVLTAARLGVHLPTRTAVAADLHLGYARARAARREAVPVPSLAEELAALAAALARLGLSRLVVAGDLFEDGRGRLGAELAEELLAWLAGVGLELAGVVPGNHDRGVGKGSGLPLCPGGLQLGAWRVIHGDGELPDGPVVQGHEHPWVRWPGRLGAPCYLVGPHRLILPAYSGDAAGVNVRGEARWKGFRCAVIAGDEVLDFGEVQRLG